ncbi:hypothetical protein EDB80DRAFT_411070 [Ilyonectria destructans]|nr:hypothetical protein EDB80DRAFT_411070 [Ilyonectria destructans]
MNQPGQAVFLDTSRDNHGHPHFAAGLFNFFLLLLVQTPSGIFKTAVDAIETLPVDPGYNRRAVTATVNDNLKATTMAASHDFRRVRVRARYSFGTVATSIGHRIGASCSGNDHYRTIYRTICSAPYRTETSVTYTACLQDISTLVSTSSSFNSTYEVQ